MNKTWREFLIDKGQNDIVDIDSLRGSVLGKIVFAYNLLVDLTPSINWLENQSIHSVPIEILLEGNIKSESLKMLIVNYLVTLIGKSKNDKISIYNDAGLCNTAKVKDFYSNRKNEINNLITARNKMYSHMDIEAYGRHLEQMVLDLNFIKEIINLLDDIFDIPNPAVRPK